MPHLNNNKTKDKPSLQQTGLPLHSAFPSEEKQTKKTQHKSHLYKAYTNHWTKLRREETKKKKEFNLLQGKNLTFLEAWEKGTTDRIS